MGTERCTHVAALPSYHSRYPVSIDLCSSFAYLILCLADPDSFKRFVSFQRCDSLYLYVSIATPAVHSWYLCLSARVVRSMKLFLSPHVTHSVSLILSVDVTHSVSLILSPRLIW